MDSLLVIRKPIKKIKAEPTKANKRGKARKIATPKISSKEPPQQRIDEPILPQISFVQLYNDLCLNEGAAPVRRRADSACGDYRGEDVDNNIMNYIFSESADSVLKGYLQPHADQYGADRPKIFKRRVRTQVVLEMGYGGNP